MFRRFMIACWALFALSALTGVIGVLGYTYYKGELLEFGSTSVFVQPEDSPYTVLQKLQANELHTERLLQNQKEIAKKYLGKPGWGRLQERDAAWSETRYIEAQAQATQASHYYSRMDVYGSVGAIAGLVAAAILLWNILVYTGRWVWMGRKEL